MEKSNVVRISYFSNIFIWMSCFLILYFISVYKMVFYRELTAYV